MSNIVLPLSVSIIAKDEEENIGRCLSSLGDIANEIILIHNDCTDKTVEVAESFDSKCFEQEWSGHIAQKNFAIKKCSEDWILCLDADEALSDELRLSIINFLQINSEENPYIAASFNRCTFFLKQWIRYGDWYPDRKIRLIRKGNAHWDGINPHDKLSLLKKGGVCFLEGDLEHFSFRNIRDLVGKSIFYSDIFLERKIKNYRANLFFIIFRCLWRFIRCYLLKLGFLDGSRGFIVACYVSFETFLKHTRMWELSKD